jgi:hypothetical protein
VNRFGGRLGRRRVARAEQRLKRARLTRLGAGLQVGSTGKRGARLDGITRDGRH